MKIAVIGLGGVGGFYGGKLSRLLTEGSDVELYYIARGAHLAEIQKNGLILETVEETITCRPTLATEDFNDLPELDVVFICVKGYELDSVVRSLLPKIGYNTVIISLLNGADITERIRKIAKKGRILPACVYIISYIETPGKVKQAGASCIVHIGSESGTESAEKADALKVLKMFDEVGIKYKWYDDPRTEIWRKFLFIASFALVTADYDAPVGAVMESEEMSSDVKGILCEIKKIADAKGIELPDDVCEKAYAIGGNFDYDSTTSFQRDFKIAGKPDEREIFAGAVVAMGKAAGLETPVTERIYKELCEKKPLK